jgi:hypothetical protein
MGHPIAGTSVALALLCLFPAAPPAEAATVYKCADARGRVEYSNLPCPGGMRIDVPTGTAAPGEAPAGSAGAEKSAPLGKKPPFAGYTRFAITSPQGAELVRDNSGSGMVAVVLAIVPQLRSDLGHAIAIFLDGVESGQRFGGPEFMLSGVGEGTHTLRAAAVGPDGSEIISSGTIAFGLLRVTGLTPRGPEAGQPGAEDQPRVPGTPPFPVPMGEPQPGSEGQPRLPGKPPIPDPMTPPAPAPAPLPAPQGPLSR